MKVSVIIPAYNEEQSIGAAVEAVLKQSYTNIEVLVVDNNSTDGTSRIVAAYKDPRVKLVLEKQKGTNHAREAGRKAATGEIIAGIDADCVPDTDWIAKGIKHFEDSKVVAVSGPSDYYDGNKMLRSSSLFVQKYIYVPVSWMLQSMKMGAVLIANNYLARSSAMSAIGGHDTSYTFYGDDTDTAKRLMPHGYIVFDTDLKMKTSARRFIREGTIHTFYMYVKAFVQVIFMG